MAQTPPPTVDALPASPDTSSPSTFDSLADAFLLALITLRTQLVALASNCYNNAVDCYNNAVSALGYANAASTSAGSASTSATAAAASAAASLAASGGTATSTTANTLAYGSFTITVQTGKSFVPGMSVKVASTASPTNWLFGDVTAYNSGTGSLTIDVTYVKGSASVSAWTVSVSGPALTNIGFLKVSDQKASGTNGGTSVAGDITQTRTLNTVEINTISGASLASDTITLPVGTYQIRASSQVYATSIRHRLHLYNVTDATYPIIGVGGGASNGAGVTSLCGQVTITAPKNFTLRHFTTGGVATNGLGEAIGTGQVEVFTQIEITKVA